jgi:ERCC4-type nuclease
MVDTKNDKKSADKEKEKDEEETATTTTDEPESKDKSEENSEENSEEKTEEKTEEKSEADKETKPEDEKEEPKELKELSEEDIFTILKTFPGVGQVMAQRIHKGGFDSREKLQGITIDDLKKIRGIGISLAETIAGGMEKAIKDFDEPEKMEEETKKEGPGITDKAVGFIKGTFSKITGFFKGKTPKGKAEEPKPGDQGEGVGKDKELKPETPSEDSDYPEVGTPEASKEPEKEPEPVTVEPSEAEPEEKILEPETTSMEETKSEKPEDEKDEPKIEPKLKPEQEQKQEEPKINLSDASGLFSWFEKTPSLRVETGKLVFKAGYNNLGELREAVVDDLVLINGIDKKEAETIYDELRKIK